MGKPIWKSKTAWFNLVSALLALCTELQPLLHNLEALGLTADAADTVRNYIMAANIVGNFVLRIITSEPVRLT